MEPMACSSPSSSVFSTDRPICRLKSDELTCREGEDASRLAVAEGKTECVSIELN